MSKLSAAQYQHVIELLDRGEDLPSDYKHLLFPPERQEYELVFAGKEREEDILAETMAVPLQPIRAFGGSDSEWHNMLIFGDNLQAMKTLLKLKENGQFTNADGKSGIKMVYIDPPFGTGDAYGPTNGEMAYSARVQGTRFISFLRRRLILIRELLASNGTIFVRLDYHFGHYIKVVMDEVFGEHNFRNEIVINRIQKRQRNLGFFNVGTESLFFYSKTSDYEFHNQYAPRVCYYCSREKEPIWEDLTSPGLRNPPQRVIMGREYLPRWGRHFMYTQEKIDELARQGRLRVNHEVPYNDIQGNRVDERPEYLQTEEVVIDNNWTDIEGYAYSNNYPTENHEKLLERIILTSSSANDIVLDAFAGSGTSLAVSEKLGRRWIGIDCGKLAIYTIQKRMLNLRKGIGNKGKRIKPSSFTLYNAGLYDFSQLKKLAWEDWRFFALNLFQCQDKLHRISGVELDGYRGSDDVLVFNHLLHGGVILDYGFIDDLHLQIGARTGDRFFIIAPAASVTFLEDYVEKGHTRYYILRIPYSIINELHSRDFEAISQPVDELQVNGTVEAVGFDFIRQPKVECEYSTSRSVNTTGEDAVVRIRKFRSEAMVKGASRKGDFETLSMVLVDYDYPYDPTRKGKEPPPPFEVDNKFFAKDIESADWKLHMPLKSLGDHVMLIYIDTYGNEYTEVKTPADFYRQSPQRKK